MSMCMPTCVHATHALLMAHALYALPHTIRVRGTCAYVVGALRSSAKRLPKFEGLLAFVDGSNAERSARGLQYAAVYSTRYIRQKHRIRYACATAYATHASEACSMQQYTRLVIYVSSYSHTLRIRYAYATHTLRIRYAYATHTLRIRYAVCSSILDSLYMCPHTTGVRGWYICVLILVICVLILLAFGDGSDAEGNARGLETYCYETFRGLQ
jgi:hypothetical protein